MKRHICPKWKSSLSNRGSITVESSIGLLVFVTAMISLMLIIQNVGFAEAVHQSLYETVEEVSAVDIQSDGECLALSSILFYSKLEPNQVLAKQLVITRADLSATGEVSLSVSWRTHLPMGGNFKQNYTLKCRLLTRGADGTASEITQQVYVTQTGSKYHVLGCNHLRSSSIPMSRKEAIENDYTPCWHCIGGLKPFEPAPGPLTD